jgi:hypothetical protein
MHQVVDERWSVDDKALGVGLLLLLLLLVVAEVGFQRGRLPALWLLAVRKGTVWSCQATSRTQHWA